MAQHYYTATAIKAFAAIVLSIDSFSLFDYHTILDCQGLRVLNFTDC